MSQVGKKNVYTCPVCKLDIVTVDHAEGVTPFTIMCRAEEGCPGWMVSHFYKVDQELPAGWEWVLRPEPSENTPLLLRKIERRQPTDALLGMPVDPLGSDLLTKKLELPDTLVKIEDIEPDNAAMKLNFRGSPAGRYIRQKRWSLPLDVALGGTVPGRNKKEE